MKINVCIGSACHLKGSYSIINALQELIEANSVQDKVEICAGFCLGHCTKAVSVQIDDQEVDSVNMENVKDFFKDRVLAQL